MKFLKLLSVLSLLFITNTYATNMPSIDDMVEKDLANHKAKCTETSTCESYLIYFKYTGKNEKHSGCGIKLTKSDHEVKCPSDIKDFNIDKLENGRNAIYSIVYYFKGNEVVIHPAFNTYE